LMVDGFDGFGEIYLRFARFCFLARHVTTMIYILFSRRIGPVSFDLFEGGLVW
jgi:hypothetical protein